MKKISVRNISLIVIVILLILSLIIGFFYIFRMNIKNVEVVFDNMLNLKSYSVYIEEYEDIFGDGDYSLEDAMQLSMNNGDFEYVNEAADDSTDLDDQHYYYNGELILTGDGINGDVYWYYKPESLITTREYNYWDSYKELFGVLKEIKFTKKDNKYVYKNSIKLNSEDEDGLTEYIYNIYNLGFGTVGDNDYIYQVQEIELEIKEEKIELVTLIFNQSCIDIDPDFCTDKKKLVISFNDYDKVEPVLSSEAKSSVEANTAGNWVGTYKNNVTCPDGKRHEETIYLSNEFSWIDGIGWEADIEVFDCDSGQYNRSGKTYNFENNKLVVYDSFDDVLVEFNFYKTYFQEVDENNNVISEFKKVIE